MREELGFVPAYSTAQALADFATTLTPTGGRTDRLLAALERQLPSGRAVQDALQEAGRG
jgi:UDP-glucose 4-epimerase